MAVTRQQTGGHVLLTAGARWTDIFTLILVSVDRYLFHIYPNFHPLFKIVSGNTTQMDFEQGNLLVET